MKRCASVLLTLMMILLFTVTAFAYTDTSSLDSVQQAALKELSDIGVLNGYPDGTFKPAATVTRAEFAKMICVYAKQSELNAAVSSFSDVFPVNGFYGWVSRAAEKDWIHGYPGGTFRPQEQVTQQEIATVLVRIAGIDTDGFVWPDDYNEAARTAGAFKDIVFVGTDPASRIIACQMFYNMLPKPDTGPEQAPSATVHGIVTALAGDSITIKDGKGVSTAYTVSANLLPDKLILGSYMELALNGNAVAQVAESIIPKKGVFVWDVALDGTSAVIDGKKYDLTEADIFTVEYTMNKTYSTETFVKGGPIDRNILSLGGRLAAEMAVIIESDGGRLVTAYLVNASVIVTGGRLDVVDSSYNSAKGNGIYFLGRDAGLLMDSSLTAPPQGLFIHYTLRNGEINKWASMLDIENDDVFPASDSYAWVSAINGDRLQNPGNPGDPNDVKPKVINIGSGSSVLQLGADEDHCCNYWLANGCLVYEVDAHGKISQGSTYSIEKGQQVIALVDSDNEICYIFCFVD